MAEEAAEPNGQDGRLGEADYAERDYEAPGDLEQREENGDGGSDSNGGGGGGGGGIAQYEQEELRQAGPSRKRPRTEDGARSNPSRRPPGHSANMPIIPSIFGISPRNEFTKTVGEFVMAHCRGQEHVEVSPRAKARAYMLIPIDHLAAR